MAMHEARIEHFFAAPRDKIFQFFADPANLRHVWGGRWQRIKEGEGDPNGVGMVRSVKVGGATFEETIVTFRRPELIEYVVSEGGPVRNHHSRMDFTEEPGGTRMVFTVRFEPKIALAGRVFTGMLKARWNRGVANVLPNL